MYCPPFTVVQYQVVGGGGVEQDCVSVSVEFVVCVYVEQSDAVQILVLVTVRVLVWLPPEQTDQSDQAPYVTVGAPQVGVQVGGGGGGGGGGGVAVLYDAAITPNRKLIRQTNLQ